MMTDQPARVTPAEISELLRSLDLLRRDSPLAERIVWHERKAALLSRIAADMDTTAAHAVAAEGGPVDVAREDSDEATDKAALFAVARARFERFAGKTLEDVAKPLVYFNKGAPCWQPEVKNETVMVNSIYNGWRMEDIWLDR